MRLQEKKAGSIVRNGKERSLLSLVCLCSICLALPRGGAEVKEKHKMEQRFQRLPLASRKAEIKNMGLNMDDVYQHLIWLMWNEGEALDEATFRASDRLHTLPF